MEMIETNLLHRRINYRQFKKDVIPPKEMIESIIKEAIGVTPFKGSFKYANIDVYGPEQEEIKHNLMLTSSTAQAGLLRYQNNNLSDEQWESRVRDHYKEHPEEFNTQLAAPYLIAVVENLDYYTYSENLDRREVSAVKPISTGDETAKALIRTKCDIDNRLAIAARLGALGYGLSLTANRHEVDACFCGCFDRKLKSNLNRLLLNYSEDNRNVVYILGMGYFDFDAPEGGRMGGYVKSEDGNYLEHNRHGGNYNLKTRAREKYKHRKPKYDEFVEWK
tara:strand:- start:63 stop:896 length:834 start_codon:yes stop_codon:yes gene_type:complete